MPVYANQDVTESTLNGSTTITFPWKAKRIVIINESALRGLQFKFSSTETYATLEPGRTVTMEQMSVKELLLNTSGSVAYKVWAQG